MTPHILTHNYYAITSLVMLTMGSFYICNHVHQRWLSQHNLSLMATNAFIKSSIVILGFSIVSWRALLESTYPSQSLSILIGIVTGFVFAELEACILHYVPSSPFSRPLLKQLSPNSINNILARGNSLKTDNEFTSYSSTALVGACEEILYRGFIPILCMSLLNTYTSIFCLLLITLFFALSHLSLGLPHVLSKFMLGLICLLSFLFTKTIVTPILIHVTFNTIAVNKFRKLVYG